MSDATVRHRAGKPKPLTALITGANGLIGANLARVLLAHGVRVRALVRPTSNLAALQGLPVERVFGDVTAGDGALLAAATGCDYVFHAAMPFTYAHTAALQTTALDGTTHVLRAARDAKVRRVVVTSSSVVFGYSSDRTVRDETCAVEAGRGESAYVRAKVAQDEHAIELAQQWGLDVVLVCPTMSVGPYATVLGPSHAVIVSYLSDPFRLTYPGGCNIVAAPDVAQGHWLAALHGTPGEHYLLGAENLEWATLHSLVADLCGVPRPQAQLNHTQAYLAATAQELLAWTQPSPGTARAFVGARPRAGGPLRPTQRSEALNTRDQAAMLGRYYWYAHSKIAQLGYRPRTAYAALAGAVSALVAGPHITREVRATLRLHPDVYALRRGDTLDAQLRALA